MNARIPRSLSRLVLVLSALALSAAAAEAQQAPGFRWQLQPFCNVVTLSIVQEGSSFLLTGTDDGCGQGSATATGTAIVNADTSISFGLVVITSSGAAEHLNAAVSPATLSGTWRDADGHTGAFHFNPGATTGAPRPAPTTSSAITSAQLATSIFNGTGQATTVSRSDHTHDDRYYTKPQVDALVASPGSVVLDVPPTALPTPLVTQVGLLRSRDSIATPKAGRLLITKSATGSINCGGNGAIFFLVLDNVPLRDSATFAPTGAFSGQLTGTTVDVVPTGPHAIFVGTQCFVPANFTGGSTETVLSTASVVVLP